MTNLELYNLLSEADAARKQHLYVDAVGLYTAVIDQTEAENATSEIQAIRLSALRERGLIQRRTGQHARALASYEQYYDEAKDSHQQVIALTQLGQQYSSMGQQALAMAKHKEALRLAETLNYANGRSQAYLGIGGVCYHLGKYDEAVSKLRKALALFTQLKDSENICRSWNWLGIVYIQVGKIDKSIAAYESALLLVREVGDLETAVVLDNLGESYQHLFDMEQALVYHREGLELAQKTNLPAQLIDIHRNMGVELCYLGQVDEGLGYLKEALRMSEAYDHHNNIMQTLYSLALAQIENGELEQAKEYADRLNQIADEGHLRGKHAQAMYVLGLYYQAIGDLEMTHQLWQQVLFFAHETGQHNLLWRVHAALACISDNVGLAQTHYRIAAEIIDQIVYPIEDVALRNKFLSAPPVKAVLEQLK